MNYEKLYREAYKASVECMNVLEWSEELKKSFIENPRNYYGVPCMGHLAWIMVEAMESMDSKITPKTTISAVKRMFDANRKDYGGIFERDGMFCVCDGYRIVRLKEDIPSLPHVLGGTFEPKKYIEDFGFERKEIPLPTLAEIKAWLQQHPTSKYEKREPYILSGCLPVNGEFLRDMMLAFPNCKAYLPQKICSPILFEADSGDGILLPVRVDAVIKSDECIAHFEALRAS